VTRVAWEARGVGAPLLLIHGLGYARWGWEPVADRLAERFRVLLFDNRGIGESEVPPGPYTAAAMAEDAAQVLDEAGAARAHVIGTSLGGMVAQELALAHPERLDRLVLVATTPGGRGAFPLPQRTLALIAEAPSLAPETALRRFVENALAPDAPDALVERIYAHRLAAPPDPAGWQAQAAAGTGFDALDRIGSIAAPTLILHGTEDGVVDPRNAALLAERIPDSRVRLFEGRGHLLFWEDPDGFADAVEEFLA
jgi:pimeloyl-ACP methyl ester carboxylesterase